MVSFETLVDEMVYVCLLIELFLGDGGIEDVVEIEVFAGMLVVNEFYLFAGGVDVYVGVVVAVFGLCFEEGSYAYGCFDFGGHNKIIQAEHYKHTQSNTLFDTCTNYVPSDNIKHINQNLS